MQMPPCTCWLRLAQTYAACPASVAATAAVSARWSPPRAAARAASHVTAVAISVAIAMLAQWCFTAWNVAMTRPNCSRTFAYSAAISVAPRATPTASALRTTRARSRSVTRAPVRIVAKTPSTVTRALRRVAAGVGGAAGVEVGGDVARAAGGMQVEEQDVVARRDDEQVGGAATEGRGDRAGHRAVTHLEIAAQGDRSSPGPVGERGEVRLLRRVVRFRHEHGARHH